LPKQTGVTSKLHVFLHPASGSGESEEGKLKEAAARYKPDFEEWDVFVSEMLEWL
jgi:hypothetical protein